MATQMSTATVKFIMSIRTAHLQLRLYSLWEGKLDHRAIDICRAAVQMHLLSLAYNSTHQTENGSHKTDFEHKNTLKYRLNNTDFQQFSTRILLLLLQNANCCANQFCT